MFSSTKSRVITIFKFAYLTDIATVSETVSMDTASSRKSPSKQPALTFDHDTELSLVTVIRHRQLYRVC